MYALNALSESPVAVHEVAARIAERTQGAWRPSAGAIYPAFRSLTESRLAKVETVAGVQRYVITPAGRRRLTVLRQQRRQWAGRLGGSWRLMLDLVDRSERAEAALTRLRSTLGTVDLLASGHEDDLPAADRTYLRQQAIHELHRALERLERGAIARRSARRPVRR
jgi:DNA-binding PadR family transcriptional regulator